jgi:hypothetical protein
MIMQNTSIMSTNGGKFDNSELQKMTFDIKGSYVNRQLKFSNYEDKFWLRSLHQSKVMKDLNYIEINKDLDQKLLRLDKDQFETLSELVKLDSEFLGK